MAIEPDWSNRFSESLMLTIAPPTALLTHGKGCYVWDDHGTKYLDFLAGIAVNSLGHAHPALVDVVSEQVATLAHVSNFFATAPQIELAERLKRITGAGVDGRVYFGNSGAEANEAAVKLARRNNETGRRTRILSLRNSFHGRTMGALALTGKSQLREPFEPLVPGVDHIDGTIDDLERTIDDRVAALFVEPIRGEAGVIGLPDGYLRRARELTERAGALLIVDEIQTGVGRTGRWFAYEHDGIMPDAVTIAKGIAGGVPIGALVTFGRASDLLTRGQHGSTFGGNPLAAAAANAVLAEIEASGLVSNAERRGDDIRRIVLSLSSPLIREIRGRGLLLGLGLTEPVAEDLARAAFAEGLIVNAPNDSSIRITPPLIIGESDINHFHVRFSRALSAFDSVVRS